LFECIYLCIKSNDGRNNVEPGVQLMLPTQPISQ